MTRQSAPQPVLPRHAAAQVASALRNFRVVVVNGPRQAGKTTLARSVHGVLGGTYVTFDDRELLDACITDPVTFVAAYAKPLIVDEFQRAGDALLYAIKRTVDEDRTPGRFLLTGSTRFLTVPTISESLAGRVAIVDLWPFSQGEIELLGPSGDAFLPGLFGSNAMWTGAERQATRADYMSRVCVGGFPEVQTMADPATRRQWFRNYLRTVTSRDAPEISRARQIADIPRLLRALAGYTAQELNVSSFAERLRMDRVPLSRTYLPLLETLYLVLSLPAWSRNLAARVATRPKVFLTDSGLAAHLLGVDASALALPAAPATGTLVETFAVNEIVRQAARHDELGVQLSHFRAHDGPSTDIVAETADGRVACIEVKAAATVSRGDIRPLARIRDRLEGMGTPFAAGVVLYTGTRDITFGDRLFALPLASLWERRSVPGDTSSRPG